MDMINLNENVKVKLTDFGINVYRIRYGIEPKVDELGYTSFQLWQLMNIYGIYCTLANPDGEPFKLDILLNENKYFHCLATSKNGNKLNMVFIDKRSYEKQLYSDSIFFSDKDGRSIRKEEILTVIPKRDL